MTEFVWLTIADTVPTAAPSGGLSSENGTTGWELALVTTPSSNESAVASSKLVIFCFKLHAFFFSSQKLHPYLGELISDLDAQFFEKFTFSTNKQIVHLEFGILQLNNLLAFFFLLISFSEAMYVINFLAGWRA